MCKYKFKIPEKIKEFNDKFLYPDKDKLINKVLLKYYKKHPIKFKNMLKNARVELKRNKNGMFVENYYYKNELICSWNYNLDYIRNHGDLYIF